jgi:hypothetical protein
MGISEVSRIRQRGRRQFVSRKKLDEQSGASALNSIMGTDATPRAKECQRQADDYRRMAADVTPGWEREFLLRIAAYWERAARPSNSSAVTDR